MAFGRWTNWLRRLRQPVGGREAEIVFGFLLSLLIAGLALFLVFGLLPDKLDYLLHRERYQRMTCSANLHQLSSAIEAYCQDYDDRLWLHDRSSRPLLPLYITGAMVFACPSDPARSEAKQRPWGSYQINTGLLGLTLKQAEGRPFLWDRGPWHNHGRNVLSLGSEPRWVREKDFDALFIMP